LADVPTTLDSATLGLSSVSAEYVSTIFIETVADRPTLTVELRDTSKLGTAAETCFTYTPAPTQTSGGNLQWSVSAGCTTAPSGGAIPAKYLPRT